ncbi:hypothetical protein IW261DRAFT_1415593 [Armillaria novae-zelandiae]|uniref:Uncharacterized protein n=1 Tax=Armillaria novae-zelandiae TaxID=153914 RepID=A0AA39PJV7_9AGAR|nr:hypothetical protein IW261DRAFT_1415593 [Armillaria novae-zelandiae]
MKANGLALNGLPSKCSTVYMYIKSFHWTGWVFFTVLIGIILVWLYTHITIQIRTLLTFPTNYCVPLLAPRYIAIAWRFGFAPDDIDLLRYIQKVHPGRYLRSPHHEEDVSTSILSVHHGFGSATEEGEAAMSRTWSHLSEKRTSSRNLTEFTWMAGHKSGKKSINEKRSHDSDGPHHGSYGKGYKSLGLHLVLKTSHNICLILELTGVPQKVYSTPGTNLNLRLMH